MNKVSDQDSSQQKRPDHKKVWKIVWLVFLILALIWLALTVATPLVKGTGVEKFSGIERLLAQDMVDVTRSVNGPMHSTVKPPDFMFQIHIDDIHAVTKDEVRTFCQGVNPAYITYNSQDRHYYTIVVTEQYLLSLGKKVTYVGCNHTDYVYTEVFDYPDGLDPRQQ